MMTGLLPFYTVLLLLAEALPAHSCPTGCICMVENTVFCVTKKAALIPNGIPADTEKLYLFEVGITTLDEQDFLGLSQLQFLDLSQNKISDLKKNIFHQLPSLRNLDLSSNQITEISNETFSGLHLLERLYLDNNKIQHIHPSAFDTLEMLLELKLQNNQLHVVPPLKLPSLLLLDISGNKIPLLTRDIFLSVNIESLKIAGLGITSLDEDLFENLKNLHELDLSDNQLQNVPAALLKLPMLTKLNISSNGQISQLHATDFYNLHVLQELDISNMNLKTIPSDFISAIPNVQTLTAAGNPFNCVCQLSCFIEWVHINGVTLKRPEETRCHFPPISAGKLLQSLKHSDLGCPTTTPTTTSSTTTTLKPVIVVVSSQPPPVMHATSSVTLKADPKRRVLTTRAPADVNIKTSPKVSVCPESICLHGGTCYLDRYGQIQCMCPTSFSGSYCERKVQVTVAPTTAERVGYPPRIHLKRITSSSVTVDLQSYVYSRSPLRGVRLIYRNLSGADNRPILLSLPASLAEYTVRALIPNSTYYICLEPLGEMDPKEEACAMAQTESIEGPEPYHTEIPSDDNTLALILVPSLTAGLLVVVAALAATWYYWNRHSKKHMKNGAAGPTPLELRTCLDNGELPSQSPVSYDKAASPTGAGTSECEILLMQQSCPTNNNCTSLKPSYF
ncbi:vasorin [Protopterus annectens]|uniref:vasorin n=1 Tax=Protopterus annectens TaxID=7888 RepID=UPI001CFA520E|nr:vasorin [Protopterus annectens]